jgi:hypothetical protein
VVVVVVVVVWVNELVGGVGASKLQMYCSTRTNDDDALLGRGAAKRPICCGTKYSHARSSRIQYRDGMDASKQAEKQNVHW